MDLSATTPIPPFSAYALCFFPLALTIIGFIVFAVRTDRHAARPYLRLSPYQDARATAAEFKEYAGEDAPEWDSGPSPSDDYTQVYEIPASRAAGIRNPKVASQDEVEGR